ncbi:MAG: hypothetical protein LBP62_06915 [Clostridiales bacterium]|jgi:hypothetical protein|nr:hypothetical protein [Clostridiales bacterium]
MDHLYIKDQTQLDVENSKPQFIIGHLYILAALVVAAGGGALLWLLFGALDFQALYGVSEAAIAATGGGVLLFETVAIVIVAFLIVFFFILTPIRVVLFGISYKFPLTLSYRGYHRNDSHNASKHVVYGFSMTGSKLIKIVLCPLITGVISFAPLVLFAVLLQLAPMLGGLLGIPALGTIMLVLVIIALLYALFMSLKFSMIPFYIADDADNTMGVWVTVKASWHAMSFANIGDYIKVNVKNWLIALAVFVPAIVGVLFLLSAALNDPNIIAAVSLDSLSSVTDLIGLELPAGFGLLPSFPNFGVNLVAGGIIGGAGALVSYVLYVVLIKLKINTASANFYSEIKDEYEIIN